MAEETRTALIASVKEREKSLKIVLKRIYDQVDKIELILNFYDSVPEWLKDKQKIVCHLNKENRHAHDSIWSYVPESGYCFVMDDDLMYPQDFCEKLILAIERHERHAVCTAHGSNLILPASDYLDARRTYGFSDRQDRDIFNDLCGVGCCAFHTDTFGDKQPSLQNFPIPFMRDLYFSLHCKKNNVSIVNVQRPSQWILPLQTPGETVYEATLNNKRLRALKNRVMKEQLLPSLHCNQKNEDNKYVLITDYGFDSRLVNKTLQTLDDVSDCNIVMFTDELRDYDFSSEQYMPKKKVLVQYVTPEERAIGICGSRVLTQYRFMLGLPNGSRVITSDSDMYFLRNPFDAFNTDSSSEENGSPDENGEESAGKEFDIAVTTRPELYKYPINSGIVMFRINDRVKDFLRFLVEQIYDRTWPDLISYEMKFNHNVEPDGVTHCDNINSWYFDQDIWCVSYLHQDFLKNDFGVRLVDVGPTFNFCPHSDGTTEQAAHGKAKLMAAYHAESVHVLHLKSKLKELLFEGLLP